MNYPDSIFTQRDIENVPGVEFDEDNKHQLYAEDYQDLAGEITAIETILGLNPQGDFDTVSERIAAAAMTGEGGGGSVNWDGGTPSSLYGGAIEIDGGGVS